MIRFKKTFILLILCLLFSSCGYSPIFSKKDVNFSIENIKFSGDKDVGEKISKALSSYENKPGKEKKISLDIKNSKYITTASKNSKGEAQTNRISIDTNVKIILSENNFFKKNFNKTSIYTVIKRKSDQELIENKLVTNLSNEIAQQIIFEILKNTK